MFPAPRKLISLALCAALLGTVSGCATLKKVRLWPRKSPKKQASSEPQAPRLIGSIVLVNRDDRFVLIDAGNSPIPLPGSALKTFNASAESGVVSVGEVRRRPFVVADIVKGAPEKGDRVFQ